MYPTKFPMWRVLIAIALGIASISFSVNLLNAQSDLAFLAGIVLLGGSLFYIIKTIVTIIGRNLQ